MQGNDHMPAVSSYLAQPVSIGAGLFVCICAAFGQQPGLSVFFGFIFLLSLSSYLWGKLSLKHLTYRISTPRGGVFPGQSVPVTRELHNGKLLPLIWLELMEPCDPKGCIRPEETHMVPDLAQPEKKFKTLYVFALLKWHQTIRFTDDWKADRRGVHCIEAVTLRSGDGFGLCAESMEIKLEPVQTIAVYPQVVDVSTDRILNDMWDSRSASHGYLEDTTLLRSVRDYAPSDPARRINQRLLARGQGLKLNELEVVTPNDVLFILDCASFAKEKSKEFEMALSVLASLLIGLSQRGIQVGLIAPKSNYFSETCVLPTRDETGLVRMLELLAAADSSSPPLQGQFYIPAPELLGQTYYLSYSAESATSLHTLDLFSEHKVKILACEMDTAILDGHALQVRLLDSIRRVS